MKILKAIGNWFLDLFGLRKNSSYVKKYLNNANMRSGVYMAAVIIILELALIIRQHQKYIGPQVIDQGVNYFESLFNNTSCFWLLLFIGAATLPYCLFYLSNKKTLPRLITIISISVVGFALSALLPLEKSIAQWNDKYIVSNYLLITFYALVAIFHVTLICAAIYMYKGGRNEWITSISVVSLFALSCLVFGTRVSYNDFFSTSDIKQIICFLMMTIYVGCLLIWKPYVSIGILGAVFLGFYFLLKYLPRGARTLPDGDELNYVTFFISLTMICISIYVQRVGEAKKDEELELLATKDTLTDLLAFEYFLTLTSKRAKENPHVDYMYLFIDIDSFKIFNDQRGFKEGNAFLRKVGQILTKYFPDGLISRQSDDHFVVFDHIEDIRKTVDEIDHEVEQLDLDIRPGIIVGGYILKIKDEDPHRSVEKARYACAVLKQRGHVDYLEYDQKMHDSYHLVQYVVKHIDEAIENGYIKPYYQPVVWSKNREFCGAEALSRWIDPKHGFMNPGQFIGALENAQLIYKLDVAMLRLVCKDLRYNMDHKLPVFPVSINFSRLDFMVMDVPKAIEEIVNEYNIPKKLIHVEITESALLEQGDLLKNAMKELKEKGFALWLDDFGSGYSSFNALKDYDFDVLKLDMQFLVGFDKNTKAKSLIQSVISMANQIGMRTLSEGVETKEQADFLNEIACGRLQGYLYGKPFPYEDLMKKIQDGELKLSKDFD